MYYISWVMCHVSLNFLSWQSGMSRLIEGLYQKCLKLVKLWAIKKNLAGHLLLPLLPLFWVLYNFLCVHLIQRHPCEKCWSVSRNRLRQEMHMKTLSGKMLKHTINILACLSFIWLKYIERFGLKHILLQTSIFVRNEHKTCLSS